MKLFTGFRNFDLMYVFQPLSTNNQIPENTFSEVKYLFEKKRKKENATDPNVLQNTSKSGFSVVPKDKSIANLR